MNKHKIFNEIKKLDFPKAASPLLDLMEKNLGRVEYVKDFIGLRDVLFVAENGASGFRGLEMYACIDVDVKIDNHDHNFVAMNESLVDNTTEIKKMITNFFKKTERTLYVVIGFQQSKPTQEDAFRVYEKMESGDVEDPFDALVKMRRFPDWYEAKYPVEIMEEMKFFEMLKQAEKNMLKQVKRDLMKEIDVAIENSDKKLFLELSHYYNQFF